MPGLLRGMARTAVVAGTATAVSNRVSRRQGERWARQEGSPYGEPQYQEPPPQQVVYQEPPPPPEPQVDKIQQLKDLASLKEQGILTDEEFAVQKAKILG